MSVSIQKTPICALKTSQFCVIMLYLSRSCLAACPLCLSSGGVSLVVCLGVFMTHPGWLSSRHTCFPLSCHLGCIRSLVFSIRAASCPGSHAWLKLTISMTCFPNACFLWSGPSVYLKDIIRIPFLPCTAQVMGGISYLKPQIFVFIDEAWRACGGPAVQSTTAKSKPH